MEKGGVECEGGVVGGTRSADGVDVVWAETRSRRRVDEARRRRRLGAENTERE